MGQQPEEDDDEEVEEVYLPPGSSKPLLGNRAILKTFDEPIDCAVSLMQGDKFHKMWKTLGRKVLTPLSHIVEYRRKPASKVRLQVYHHLSSIADEEEVKKRFTLIAFEYNHESGQLKEDAVFDHDEKFLYISGKPNCSVGLALRNVTQATKFKCCLTFFRQKAPAATKCPGHVTIVDACLHSQVGLLRSKLREEGLVEAAHMVEFELGLDDLGPHRLEAVSNSGCAEQLATLDLRRLISEGHCRLGEEDKASRLVGSCETATSLVRLRCTGSCQHGKDQPIFEAGAPVRVKFQHRCTFVPRPRVSSAGFYKEGVAIRLQFGQDHEEEAYQERDVNMFENERTNFKWDTYSPSSAGGKTLGGHIEDAKKYFGTLGSEAEIVLTYYLGRGRMADTPPQLVLLPAGQQQGGGGVSADDFKLLVTDRATFPAAKTFIFVFECIGGSFQGWVFKDQLTFPD